VIPGAQLGGAWRLGTALVSNREKQYELVNICSLYGSYAVNMNGSYKWLMMDNDG